MAVRGAVLRSSCDIEGQAAEARPGIGTRRLFGKNRLFWVGDLEVDPTFEFAEMKYPPFRRGVIFQRVSGEGWFKHAGLFNFSGFSRYKGAI